ncbi:MAG TPA: magnesium-translocating P-type ATPase [Polyangiaceae bacterium]|nr:magnesium-translocating P-type ATPase [Polyangiaceae bacterium]
MPARELFERTRSRAAGLEPGEAAVRLRSSARHATSPSQAASVGRVVLAQLESPLVLLLVFAAAVSALTREWVDSTLVIAIVVVSVGISAYREYQGQAAAAALAARIRTRASVIRAGVALRVPAEEVVVGDIILLSAGSLVPADAVVLEASDCQVNEAVLTGEAFGVEKAPGWLPAATPLARRTNVVYQGSNVQSGSARCLVVAVGAETEYGAIAATLRTKPPETEFDRGLRHFGYLLVKIMVLITVVVFTVHVALERPALETLLFAIALAVGLSPELLPAILSVNLARGAAMMASRGVLVRHLSAIENLGSMDVLCTDKTGTLTEGVVRLEGAYDASGARSSEVLELGAINARFETGLPSPLDDAILHELSPEPGRRTKLAELPFDFVRKRVSVVVGGPDGVQLITKGAVRNVLEVATLLPDGCALDAERREQISALHASWAGQGIRALAVASRRLNKQRGFDRNDETELTFEGFLTFVDRPKPGANAALADLARLGVCVKIITGDARLVAEHIARQVGIDDPRVLTGAELDHLDSDALRHAADRVDLFVEVDPRQKERIITSLRRGGHVVGFLGDGVNDAPAMHAADTSLSVDQAVDVAREAADFVLLERDLGVLRRGIEAGRKTFANTLKYVLTTTSANLGNMISMALASLWLPFLPMLAGQVLLNNFLSDIPAIGLGGDAVDDELVAQPRRWDMRFIQRFMLEFGAVSSAFDLITFGVLLFVFDATVPEFRTGWFVLSLLTELVVALVVRTRRPFFRSRPGALLSVSTLALVAVALALPFLPRIDVLGFSSLPLSLLATLVGITGAYVVAVEALKHWFYRRYEAASR